MVELVWVSSWEIHCCGEPFSVGGTVRWEVAITRETGAETFGVVDLRPGYRYAAHDSCPVGDAFTMVGTVVSIDALHQDLHLKHDPNRRGATYYPTPGTERLTSVDSDQQWELEPAERLRQTFAGWFVRIEVQDLQPLEVEEWTPGYRPKFVNDLVVRLRGIRSRAR